jgi:nicotinate-nucleotide pyrophosphorylase (carboxylating)
MTDLSLPAPLPDDIATTVARALAEDVGSGDVTASLIPAAHHCSAEVLCREQAVLAGQAWFDAVYASLDPTVAIEWHQTDAQDLSPDSLVCTVRGPARSIVTGERCALNFLQTLSATATATRSYVNELAGSGTQILDTRKTIPGLRSAQKYAVRCGGGANHRLGLFDAVLIKENHIAAAGSIAAAISAIRNTHPGLRVEVEVETMAELEQALNANTDMVLLDNFAVNEIHAATQLVAGRAKVEISGGVDFNQLRQLGQTGADYISVGALTKHVRAIDFSMRVSV